MVTVRATCWVVRCEMLEKAAATSRWDAFSLGLRDAFADGPRRWHLCRIEISVLAIYKLCPEGMKL